MTIRILFLGIALLIIAGCGDSRPPAEIVGERAQARWDALLAQDFETAWGFESPGFRQTVGVPEYRFDKRQGGIKWLTAKVQDIECEVDRCNVAVLIVYELARGGAMLRGTRGQRSVMETWIRSDGGWWHVSS